VQDFDSTGPRPGPPPAERDADIDAAVAGLDDLDQLPLAEHVERFDTVHVALTAALAGIDRV